MTGLVYTLTDAKLTVGAAGIAAGALMFHWEPKIVKLVKSLRHSEAQDKALLPQDKPLRIYGPLYDYNAVPADWQMEKEWGVADVD